MRNKLIEIIRSVQYNDNGSTIGNNFQSRFVERIADHLIENGITFATDNNVGSKWISVNDRLPENDYGKHWKERKHYLVSLAPSGLMCVAHYGYKEYGWWIDGHDCVLSATTFKEVTHWMPLPEPPEVTV